MKHLPPLHRLTYTLSAKAYSMALKILFIIILPFSTTANALDKFDVSVCEATTESKMKLECYKELKEIAQCRIGSIEQQLTCHENHIALLIKAQANTIQSRPDHATTVEEPLPIDLKIKGGNWNALVYVDKDCIYTGRSDYDERKPNYAHLSQVKLVIEVYPTKALLVCKDGSECMLSTQQGRGDLTTHARGKPYLVKTDRITILVDYGNYYESAITIERKLGEIIRHCQSIKPNPKWVNQFGNVRNTVEGP